MAKRHRHSAFLPALLAMVIHATVLSWHVSAQTARATTDAALFAELHVICGSDGKPANENSPLAPIPAHPDCPICQGLAAVGAVDLARGPVLFLPPSAVRVGSLPEQERGNARPIDVNRNRGPPTIV